MNQNPGPSSADSVRYQKALEQADRLMKITKDMIGYVSSDEEMVEKITETISNYNTKIAKLLILQS